MALLEVTQAQAVYRGVTTLKGISFTLGEHEIVTLIGSNGSGKSATLRMLSGIHPASSGSIVFNNEPITHLPPHEIVRRGLIHVPEGRRIFGQMTVYENLVMGAYSRQDTRGIQRDIARVFELFPQLRARSHQSGGSLSGGEQQMLAMGRALMGRPRLLLLDEPSLGLSPKLVRELFAVIADLNREGIALVLVEQKARMALTVAHRAYVLQAGRIVYSGSASTLRDDPAVISAYLGGEIAQLD